jgi:hypoxanthine phosphoribosyltransferase
MSLPGPSDYAHRQGVLPISWEDFHSLCKGLAQAVAPFHPEIILAVGRGGFYPGTLLTHILRVELYPVYLTRRVKDVVKHPTPRWRVKPPRAVRDQRVLVVDEISSSGETLNLVRAKTANQGAREVRTAVLYAHSWGIEAADYIGLISDALILNPWDRELYQDGQFVFHPEYVEALAKQNLAPIAEWMETAPAAEIAQSKEG